MNDAAIYINVVSCVDMCFPFSLVHARSATVGSRGNSNYWGTARFFQSSSTILHTLMTLVKHAVISREVHDQVSLLFTLFLPPFKNWQLQHFPGGLVVRTRLSLLRPRFNPWSCDPAKKKKKTKKLSKQKCWVYIHSKLLRGKKNHTHFTDRETEVPRERPWAQCIQE